MCLPCPCLLPSKHGFLRRWTLKVSLASVTISTPSPIICIQKLRCWAICLQGAKQSLLAEQGWGSGIPKPSGLWPGLLASFLSQHQLDLVVSNESKQSRRECGGVGRGSLPGQLHSAQGMSGGRATAWEAVGVEDIIITILNNNNLKVTDTHSKEKCSMLERDGSASKPRNLGG